MLFEDILLFHFSNERHVRKELIVSTIPFFVFLGIGFKKINKAATKPSLLHHIDFKSVAGWSGQAELSVIEVTHMTIIMTIIFFWDRELGQHAE